MGLSNFPSAAEGVLPVLVINTVMSVAILKNLLRSVLQLMGAAVWISSNFEENPSTTSTNELCPPNRRREISITKFKYLCGRERKSSNSKFALEGKTTTTIVECCVCLCKFGEEEEVSQLSCKHFSIRIAWTSGLITITVLAHFADPSIDNNNKKMKILMVLL